MFFELDAPKELLKDGAILVQWAQMTPVAGGNKKTFACATQIGNPDFTKVAEFDGATSFETATATGSTYD